MGFFPSVLPPIEAVSSCYFDILMYFYRSCLTLNPGLIVQLVLLSFFCSHIAVQVVEDVLLVEFLFPAVTGNDTRKGEKILNLLYICLHEDSSIPS